MDSLSFSLSSTRPRLERSLLCCFHVNSRLLRLRGSLLVERARLIPSFIPCRQLICTDVFSPLLYYFAVTSRPLSLSVRMEVTTWQVQVVISPPFTLPSLKTVVEVVHSKHVVNELNEVLCKHVNSCNNGWNIKAIQVHIAFPSARETREIYQITKWLT